jgi:hypothetical protein
VPDLYGQAEGNATASSVAAPLLAGGALALAGVIIQQEDALRFPGVALLLLVGAVALLIVAVQCGIWARQYVVTPAEIEQWWPAANEARRAAILRDQHWYAQRHRIWARRVTLTFNLGVLALWAAIAVAAAPPSGVGEPAWRWAAAALALVAALAEAAWIGLVIRGPVVPGQRLAWASNFLYGSAPPAPAPPAPAPPAPTPAPAVKTTEVPPGGS